MIRLVIDTNVAVSGLLWWGPASHILWCADNQNCQILATGSMLDELKTVLYRSKFKSRLIELAVDPEEPLTFYRNLVHYCPTPPESIIRCPDADDQQFINLAEAEQAHMLISGDRHVLDMNKINTIPIVRVNEAAQIVTSLNLMP